MISIIGAGPVGSYLAYLLAKNKQEVAIFEEHEEIGKPIHCTGIVTEDINNLIKLDKSLISNITAKAKIYSKEGCVEIRTREIVLFRDRFDRYLLKLALSAGAKLYTGYKYERFEDNTIYFSNDKTFKTDILIGADGPNSSVAKTNGLWIKRDFYVGVQARVKLNFEQDTYKVFFGNNFPKFFGWIVPENGKIARVGIAAIKNPDIVFENFLKKLNITKKSIIEKQGGLIPIFNPKQKLQKSNVFLVGDAAGIVKATTGGGLITGLSAAKVLCDCIICNKFYEKEFRKKLAKSLLLHLKLRKILDRFNDEDYNLLLEYISQNKVKKILSENSRENPLKLILKLLIKEPRFFRFINKI